MCGRFTHLYTWKQLHRLLSLLSPEQVLAPRYNVAPTQESWVVVFDESLGGPALRSMRWGLVPSWAKDAKIGSSLINARAEGLEAKPSFRSAFRRRRGVVPVSGFYEWRRVEGEARKQPYYIFPRAARPADPDPWLLAGLWESWRDPAGPEDAPRLHTFTIITTPANEPIAPLHGRMPAILSPEHARRWLAPTLDPQASGLVELLRPCPPEWVSMHLVSTLVNSPRNDRVQCTQPLEQPGFGSIFGPDAS